MANIRGVEQLLADFDRRQRPDARSRNRVVTKYVSISDTVTLSTDSITLSYSTHYEWATAASTASQIYWGEFEWI